MKDDKSCTTKLSPCNLGISLGVAWGLSLMLMAFLGMWLGVGKAMTEAFGGLYHGIEVSYKGGLIAFGWGFLQGYVGGVIIAVVYNFCSCRCPCSSCKSCRTGK